MENLSRRRWHFLSLLLPILLGSTALNQQAVAQTPYTWGNGVDGELGGGTYKSSSVPQKLTAPTRVTTVSAGDYHSLVVKSDGMVWAWGYNGYGQLGNGSQFNSNVPVQVSGLTGVVQVSGGYDHSLALKSDGTVWSWGDNYNGELGNGANGGSLIPVQVSGLTGVVQVAAGYYHSLALKADGTVWAWGWNIYGQLGEGTNNDSNVPVQVSGLTGVVQVSVGYGYSLALKSDGTVWAWGVNGTGQFGDGTTTDSNIPVQSQASGITQIATGLYHSVALAFNGTVWAWGYNGYAQLGNGTNTDSNVPIQVSNITNAVSIAAGGFHTLALTSNGNLWSWGANGDGQLGNGTNTGSNLPILAGVQGMTVISGGASHTIAVGTSQDTKVTVPSVTAPYGAIVLKSAVTLGDTAFPLVRRIATFLVDGNVVASGFTDASGTFTTPPMTFSVGTHILQVNVAGFGAFNPGVGTGTLKVTKSGTTLKASNATVALGGTCNLTATLTQKSDGTVVQGAKVTFSLDGTVVGSANTVSTGVATFAYKSDGTLLVGKHKIDVSFAGDASRSATKASATLTINKGSTRLTQKSVTAKPSTAVNLKATLTRSSDGMALANQSLTFYVGDVLIATGTTDTKGVAVVSFTTSASSGTYPLKVTFDGDTSYAKSVVNTATLTVK